MMTPERDLRGDHEMPALLFSVQHTDGPAVLPEYRSPRHSTPRRGSEPGVTPSRRSLTPPGSMHTDTTPAPPPIARLQDDAPLSLEPRYSRWGSSPEPRTPGADEPPPIHTLASAAATTTLLPVEPYAQYDDEWVTVYGFSPEDMPLVMSTLQTCGDILGYGTYGAASRTNYLHVHFQNKYAAQRCLQKSGEEWSTGLIIGVRPVARQHKQAIEEMSSGFGGGSPAVLMRPRSTPMRPYTVEAAGVAVPQPSKSIMSKLGEYVFGV